MYIPHLSTHHLLRLELWGFSATQLRGPIEPDGLCQTTCQPKKCPRSFCFHVIDEDKAGDGEGLDGVQVGSIDISFGCEIPG